MPRESVYINISTTECYEAGAEFLAWLAYPAVAAETQRIEARQSICRSTIVEMARAEQSWAWQPQPIKPGYFLIDEVKAAQCLKKAVSAVNTRLVMAKGLLALVRNHFDPTLTSVGGERITLNGLSVVMLRDLGYAGGEGNTKHLQSRQWTPSRPVAHAAAGLALAINDWQRSNASTEQGAPMSIVLHEQNVLAAALGYSERLRTVLPLVKNQNFQDDELVRFIMA